MSSTGGLTYYQVGCLLLLYAFAACTTSQRACVPLVTCPALMEDHITNLLGKDNICSLDDDSNGGLCGGTQSVSPLSLGYLPPPRPTVSPSDSALVRQQDEPLKYRLRRYEQLIINSNLSPKTVDDLVCAVEKQTLLVGVTVLKLALLDKNLAEERSPEALQLLFAQPSADSSLAIGMVAQVSAQLLIALNNLGTVFKIPPEERIATNNHFELPPATGRVLEEGSQLLPDCTPLPVPECGETTLKYRTHDGTCNNRLSPRAGGAHTQYSRYFPSDYDDGVAAPRSIGFNGKSLPSPRRVSSVVNNVAEEGVVEEEDVFRTIAATLFGQFVDHDITSTPEFALESRDTDAEESVGEEGAINCCHRNGSFPAEPLHPTACNPIRVPDDDPVFSPLGVNCMNQVKSIPAPSEDCLARPLAQQNQITHFLDGSNIYGSSDLESQKLRKFTGGLLRTTEPGNLLPRDSGRCTKDPDDCFISGDHRAGENIGLAFMHLVWTREHNRVASYLATRHPGWQDEQLYQEARRVTIAEYQHIVYNEWLPAILGYAYVRDHGLKVDPNARHALYAPDINPTVTTEFSTAAFRFGHSMIHDVFQLMQSLPLENTFFNSTHLARENIVLQLAKSLTAQRPGRVDTTFSSAIMERLFTKHGTPSLDLIALNINRGREHGLAAYVTALENCAQRDISSWDDFSPYMSNEAIERLKSVYDDYRDVDLFMGGVSEKRAPAAAVGFTFQCIIGEQFFDFRYGDRFFYDNADQAGSFTGRQQEQLQLSSMARLLCDNVPQLRRLQKLVFFQPDFFLNAVQSCDDLAIPSVDLRVFD